MSEIRIDTRSLELWQEKLGEAIELMCYSTLAGNEFYEIHGRVAGVSHAISKWLQMTTGAESTNHDTNTRGGCQGGV